MQSEELLCMLTCTVAIDVKLSKVRVASTTTASGVGEADNDPLAAPLSLQILQRLSRQGRVPSYGRCVLTRVHTAYSHVFTLRTHTCPHVLTLRTHTCSHCTGDAGGPRNLTVTWKLDPSKSSYSWGSSTQYTPHLYSSIVLTWDNPNDAILMAPPTPPQKKTKNKKPKKKQGTVSKQSTVALLCRRCALDSDSIRERCVNLFTRESTLMGSCLFSTAPPSSSAFTEHGSGAPPPIISVILSRLHSTVQYMLTCASIYPDDAMRERLADSHLMIALVSENGEALVTTLRRKKKKRQEKGN